MWRDRRLMDLFNIEHPIVLAPMAGAMDADLVIEVCESGGLGSLPSATIDEAKLRSEIAKIRSRTRKPVNVNFFCHTPPELNNAREARWRERLKSYYTELGIDPAAPVPSSNRMPFDAALCSAIEELKRHTQRRCGKHRWIRQRPRVRGIDRHKAGLHLEAGLGVVAPPAGKAGKRLLRWSDRSSGSECRT